MKLIIIRGLPGSGKTEISKRLLKKLTNAIHIEVDSYKRKIRPKFYSLTKKSRDKKSREYSYKQTLLDLKNYLNKDYVIIDEMICEKDFYNKINKFISKNKLEYHCFRIKRTLKELLKVETTRIRPVKNSLESFQKLEKEMNSYKFKGEISINNKTIIKCLKEILKHI